MSEEERERLKQARERNEERKQAFAVWKERGIVIEGLPVPDMITDIDFLLSLLDSRAATTLHVFVKAKGDDRCVTCGNLKLWQYHVDEEVIAIRMRDACVEKVRSMREAWQEKHSQLSSDAELIDRLVIEGDMRVADEIITALESLTLDENQS